MVIADGAPALISSKLNRPRLTARHIPRPRLVDMLQRCSDQPLTLVCAPAGSGKSTVLSEWLVATDWPGAWVSLDDRENDLITFVNYLVAAVKTIFPTIAFETSSLVRAPVPPPLETLASSLSNDLDTIREDFLLVLDDYHVITNPRIDELLLEFVRHPPRNLHLAVASRVEPPWPLAAFRARGQVTDLRYADLQFTAEESAAFVRKALGDALDNDLVATLHDESEGWAAGLQLITLVAGHDVDLMELTADLGIHDDIGSYLFDEVLSRQPAIVQRRLLELSILGRFCGPLCEVVCDDDAGDPNAWGSDFISRLEHRNLFVIPLDGRHEFYRFHHLFKRFLEERLRELREPEDIATMHRRASVWFDARGLLEEALDHALAANDTMSMAELIARHRHELYNDEQFSRLTRFLRLLPIEAKENNPELLLAEARIATLNWRFTEAAVFLDRAGALLTEEPIASDRGAIALGELATLRGILDLWDGNSERLVRELEYALEMLPLGASHLRGLAYMGIIIGYWQRGDSANAWSTLHDQLAQTSPHLPLYATLLQAQGFLQWVDGDFPNIHITGRRLLAVSEELDLPDQIALAHYLLGIVHLARNELELAEEQLTAAMGARFTLRLLWWCQAAGALALTYQALGEGARAQQTLADARDFLLERHAIRILPNIEAFQTEVNRQQGRLADAMAWAALVEPLPLSWAGAMIEPQLAQARAYLSGESQTNLEKAVALIAELSAFCARVPNRRLLMEVKALTALLEDQRGEREAALDTLHDLVLTAEPIGWLRLFVDLGEPMGMLLRQLATRPAASRGIARILSAFPARLGRVAPVKQSGLVEPLSQREFEILALLGERDSNKEIAARLFIAPSTVKRHTLNIYRKLEVNDRRAAAARARELGLYPTG